MEKKLEVKNLQVSFRTQSGIVKAVRDISFDLYKGETLAIVGESGSGKSVTSKSVMGILSGNAIVEGGEIIYDGTPEEVFTRPDFKGRTSLDYPIATYISNELRNKGIDIKQVVTVKDLVAELARIKEGKNV